MAFPKSCYVFREILLPNARVLLKVGDPPSQWEMAGFGRWRKEATLYKIIREEGDNGGAGGETAEMVGGCGLSMGPQIFRKVI